VKTLKFINLLALIAFLITACAGSAPARTAPEPAIYTIEMREYSFAPNTLDLKVGQQVTINLVNNGQLAHEIMFGRGVALENSRPIGYQEDMFEAGGVGSEITGGGSEGEHEAMGHGGYMAFLEKTGDQASITFTVTEEMLGEWEMGCFEQEGVHYDAGMKGKVIVSD
jgi:plastocyanin